MQHATQPISKPLLTPRAPQGDEARVAAVFGAIEKHLGFVPDALRLYSFSPPLLENFVANISYFNSGERLPPALMAMVRYLVSSQAKCQFCITMNEGFLLNMGHALDAIRAARTNPELAPLPEKEKSLLRIALKAVNSPDAVMAADIEAAHTHGWSDRDIFDVVAQAASNRALNLVLRTFNVEQQGTFN
jgi:alkylhydroperoxidase family enzyme